MSLLSFGYMYYEVIRKNESKLVPQEKLSHRGIWHNPRGSTPGFKWQGWSNGGKNQNPKKSLDQNLTPKKSLAEFPSHKNLQKALNYITRKRETLVLNTQKNTYLNQATPRKYLPKFSYPKKSRNRKFQTPKNPSIIPVTWNPKDTLGTHPDRVFMSISKWPMTAVL